MRRTLFVVPPRPRSLPPGGAPAPASRAGSSARLIKDVERSGLAADGAAWLGTAEAARARSAGRPPTAGSPRPSCAQALPELSGTVSISPGSKWGGDVPIAPRLLTLLGVRGDIVRGRNAGHWRLSRHAWTPTDGLAGRAAGPAAHRRGVRRAGAALAVARSVPAPTHRHQVVAGIDRHRGEAGAGRPRGGRGVPRRRRPGLGAARRRRPRCDPVEPWAALLPVLDPTTMGWKERDFYLGSGPHAVPLRQQRQRRHHGLVERPDRRLLGPGRRSAWCRSCCARTSAATRAAALDAEAARLTEWLDGVRISSVYSSLQMKSALLP